MCGEKSFLTDSIIVGTLPEDTCSDSQPSWTPGSSSIKLIEPSFGIMMSSFNQLRSKMDGTGQWHLSKIEYYCQCHKYLFIKGVSLKKALIKCFTSLLCVAHSNFIFPVKGYPVIDGVLLLSKVVFARFTANLEECPYKTFAIGNNPKSPDAVHPAVMTTTTLLNCDTDSLIFFHDPDPQWIKQEVDLFSPSVDNSLPPSVLLSSFLYCSLFSPILIQFPPKCFPFFFLFYSALLYCLLLYFFMLSCTFITLLPCLSSFPFPYFYKDCIDMDCDGPKHALIDDRDGTFLGTHPLKGSAAPFAELR